VVLEVELAVEELKSHKSTGVDQIPAELIKLGVEQFAMVLINLLFLSGMRRNYLSSGRSWSFYLCIRGVIKQIVVITGVYQFCELCTKFYPTTCSQG
jgi:hypothetical protein